MKRLSDLFKKGGRCSLPLYFFSLVFLDYALRLFYRFLGDTALLAVRPMVFTVSWALLLTALISLLPRLGRRIAMGACALFFAAAALAHGVLYNIFGHVFSFSDLSFTGDGAKFFSWSYFSLRRAFLLCLLLFLFLVLLAILLAQKPKPEAKHWKGRAAALALAAVCVVSIAWTHHVSMPRKDAVVWWGSVYDPNSPDQLYGNFTDSNRCLPMVGLYQYTFRDLTVSLGIGEDHESVERLNEYFSARSEQLGDPTNDRTGTLQGKNLIMVMMESVDTWMVTPDYMPNLWELKENGVDFTRFYTPLFLKAGTFTTEIITQTGMIPAVAGLPSTAYSTNSFPLSLASLFREEGYSANSFHSASPDIYSRGSIHANLGFEAYHSAVEMHMDDYRLDSQMINGYDQMVSDGPFFSFLITYSGHGPYTEESGEIAAPCYEAAKAAVARCAPDVVREAAPAAQEEYTRAVAHIMQTDLFLGELVERLKADGLWEDTVLVLYGDHYGKYLTDAEFLHRLKGAGSADPAELYHTPCFLCGGGLKGEKVDKVCSTVDLAPTLVNLFGLPADLGCYVGSDIFGPAKGVAMFPNYEWFDGETYYSGDHRGEATEETAAVTADVIAREDASMDALKCDYFKSRE